MFGNTFHSMYHCLVDRVGHFVNTYTLLEQLCPVARMILRFSVLSHCGIYHILLGDNYTEFKGLSPEDAKTKLAQLIKDEVDLNKDGLLTEDEIRQRFHVTTKEYRKKEVMETMKQHDEGKFVHVNEKGVL